MRATRTTPRGQAVTVTVSDSYGDVGQYSFSVNVQPALTSIAVTPASPSVAKGLTEQFTATGTYTDNSTQNLTSQVTWASATTSVATITEQRAGHRRGATGHVPRITRHLDGVTARPTLLTVTAAALVSIAVTPANPSIAKGLTEQFTATGTYTDNSTQNLTSQVTWASATTSVATINAAGLATGVGTGTSHISATAGRRHRLDPADGDCRDAGVDRRDPGQPEHRQGADRAVHGHRHLHRQLDAEPHQPGDLGLGHHLGGHDHTQRVWPRRVATGTSHDHARRWAASPARRC